MGTTRFISSLAHPQVKHIVQLHNTKARKEHNQTFAEGYRTLLTLNKVGIIFDKLYSTPEQEQQAAEFQTHELYKVTPAVMAKISAAVTPSGLLGIFTRPTSISLSCAQEHALTFVPALALAQLQDPGNMGTLLRTAAACGIKTVVCIEGTDPWSPKVIQASAGTLALLTILEWRWQDLITYKNSTHAFQLCALVPIGGQAPTELPANFSQQNILIVGNEAHGIIHEWLEQCDSFLSLPMPGGTESLNAAVAGSIALYITQVLPYSYI
jgi:RNA methyltransferase, TrmH family